MPRAVPRPRTPLAAALVLALAALLGILAPEARADQKVTTILSAATADGSSTTVSFVGVGEHASYAFQVVWTGTATLTLEASLDGTSWMAAAGTFSASKAIITGPVIGGMTYRVTIASCSGCSVTAKVTVSGGGQVVAY